jgi:aminoglycoside phosphotransferase family enzyme/predicted kinase
MPVTSSTADISIASLLQAELCETHSGIVVLAGDRAYKVKKPVNLGFLDFRSQAARWRACERELELNRRLAPDVYLDLATVTGSDGAMREPMLVMRRMPAALRLAALIGGGVDVEPHLEALAQLLATFHAHAKRSPEIADEGRAAGLRRRWNDNLDETRTFCGSVLDSDLHEQITVLALRYIDGRNPLLDQRADAGLIVDGHGDLIAEDIFCLPDHPRVLDCLDFDARLRWVDVLDDVAFLAMDLEHLGRADLGARFLDRYAKASHTPAVPSLKHHYIAYRAFVRAKVTCIRAAQGVPAAAADACTLARLALTHLQAGEVTLTLVGGGPGTGKTTLASALAEHTGALLLSTDVVRGELSPTGADRYSDAGKTATYRELLARATDTLQHGRSVIADATWPTTALRGLADQVSAATSSPLIVLECHAPLDMAAARAQTRADRGQSLSDADSAVARRMAGQREPWPDATPIDTSTPVQQALTAALRAMTGI